MFDDRACIINKQQEQNDQINATRHSEAIVDTIHWIAVEVAGQ